jgi:hypothetical protein
MHLLALTVEAQRTLATVSRRADERRRGLAVAELAILPYRCASEGRDGTRG